VSVHYLGMSAVEGLGMEDKDEDHCARCLERG
jgi:hypothetical protein